MSSNTSTAEEASVIQKESGRRKLLDIERGKGIGILLVVYGHLVMFGTLGEQYWYQITKSSIYLFHMPLFMYLSGYVYFYTGAYKALDDKYKAFALKRLDRLMLPFLAFALLSVVGKIVASTWIHVDDNVAGLGQGLWDVIRNSPKNPAISVWYLLVLFVYSVVTPLVWRLLRGNIYLLLALAFALYFVPVSELFYGARILKYFVFFVIGMYCCKYSDFALGLFSKFFPLFLAAFALFIYIGHAQPYPLLVCGIASIPVVHAIARSALLEGDKFLLWIGQNSMVIYLFNTIFIGVTKGIYVKIMPVAGFWFVLLICVLMLAGTFLPIICKYAARMIHVPEGLYKYIR